MTTRIFLMVIMVFAFTGTAFAGKAGDVKKGNRFYLQGDYRKASDKYADALKKDQGSDIINFNMGTALYKQGDYEGALSHLQKSLLSEDAALKEKSYYNLGNALYKSGIRQENKNISTAIESLKQSLSYYEKALAADTKDEDAQFNYDFVKKELERLKKKDQQQKQDQKQDQQQQKQPQKSQDGENNKDQKQDQQQQSQSGDQQKESRAQTQSQDRQDKQNDPSQPQGDDRQQNESSPGADEQKEQGDAKSFQDGQQSREEPGRAQSSKGKEMSEREARMLLQQYEETEEPKGLINFSKGKSNASPVAKDW